MNDENEVHQTELEAVVIRAFESAIGKRSWGAKSGLGSFLSLEFGSPLEGKSKVKHGEMNLWITNGVWTIARSGQKIFGSDYSREAILDGIGILNDRVLLSASFDMRNFALRMEFSDGIQLGAHPSNDTTYEDWFFYFGDHQVIIAGPRPKLIQQQSNK